MVPNHRFIVEDVYDAGDYDLTTHAGQARYVDDAVAALHAHDQRWGHLKKFGNATNIHGHAEDAALYLSDTPGQSQAVDFISGAGGPNPQPGWGVDVPRYSRSDWYPPSEHPPLDEPEQPEPQPPHVCPPAPVVPGRDEALDELNWLDAYYAAPEGLQRPNGLSLNGKPDFLGIAAWYLDVYQRERINGKSRADARAVYVSNIRHSHEWQTKHPGETP